MSQCAGVRFAVGRLVQLVYNSAASVGKAANDKWMAMDADKFTLDKQGMELLRASLGHPINFVTSSVRCIVSGVRGLDVGSCGERFAVAARLWAEGMYVTIVFCSASYRADEMQVL